MHSSLFSSTKSSLASPLNQNSLLNGLNPNPLSNTPNMFEDCNRDGSQRYELQSILDETTIQGKPYYLIKWKGYCSSESTWEPIQNLIDALDIVHDWKKNNSPYSKAKPSLVQLFKEKNSLDKNSKKIWEKEHSIKQKLLQAKLNSEVKKKKKKRKVYNLLEQDSQGSQNLQKELDTCQNIAQDDFEPQIKTRSKSRKSTEVSSLRFQPTGNKNKNKCKQVNGFKIVGKVTRQTIKSVLWIFDWENNKICQVQLRDGRKVNMRKDDVKMMYPEKLLEYYQKLNLKKK